MRPALQRLWRVEAPLDPPAVPLRTWMENGPPESSVDLVFVGDGYTAEELGPAGKYWNDVSRVSLLLFREAPLSWYRDSFNVRALFLESKESGCDRDPETDSVDTALDACFNADGTPRIRDKALLGQVVRRAGGADIVLVMVNDEGCSGTSALSGFRAPSSPLRIATFCSGCPEAHEVAAHELGHAFADLDDEYVDDDLAKEHPHRSAGSPNVTILRRASSTPWRHFLALPDAGRFEWLHEGAFYREKRYFRPWPSCRMRDSSDPFCPVCCEAVARSIFRACRVDWDDAGYHRAHPLDGWAPAKSVTSLTSVTNVAVSMDAPSRSR